MKFTTQHIGGRFGVSALLASILTAFAPSAAVLAAEADSASAQPGEVTVETRLPFAGDQPGQFFYTTLPISLLNVEMDKTDAEMLFRKPPHDKSSFPLKVVDGSNKFDARVEVKGSFTRRFLKKSLLIKLEKGAWQGSKYISLNSMVTDASMMREWMAWDMARAMGMAVPKSFYTRLYINGKYAGLFLYTEWIGSEMFNRAGLGGDGELFHANDATFCADLSTQSTNPQNKCWLKWAPKDEDFSSLERLTKEIEDTRSVQFHDFMNKNFQVDSVINWIALNGLTSDSDTYNKNYFLYNSKKTGKWSVVPWDYDLTFGRNWDPYLPFPQNTLNDNFQYYYSPDSGFPSALKVKVLENRVLMERLRNRLRQMLGLGKPSLDPSFGWFTPERMNLRIDTLKAELTKDAEQDPYSAARVKLFEEDAEALKYYVLARYNYLKHNIVGDDSHWVYIFDPNAQPPTTFSSQNLSASASLHAIGNEATLFDHSNGLMVAVVKARSQYKPAHVLAKAVTYHKPDFLPPGRRAEECIQRNWALTQTNPGVSLVADVTLEYLQEHSKHHEIGAAVKDKRNMELYVLEGKYWRPVPTEVNSLAKTFTVRNLSLPDNLTMKFAACVKREPGEKVEELADYGASSRETAEPHPVAPAPAAAVTAEEIPAQPSATVDVATQEAEAARLQAEQEAKAQQEAAKTAEAQRLQAEQDAQAKREADAALAAKLQAEQDSEAARQQALAAQEAEAARLQAEQEAAKAAEAQRLQAAQDAQAKQESEAALAAKLKAEQDAEGAKLNAAQDEQARRDAEEAEAQRRQAEDEAKAKQDAERLKAELQANIRAAESVAPSVAEEAADSGAAGAEVPGGAVSAPADVSHAGSVSEVNPGH